MVTQALRSFVTVIVRGSVVTQILPSFVTMLDTAIIHDTRLRLLRLFISNVKDTTDSSADTTNNNTDATDSSTDIAIIGE